MVTLSKKVTVNVEAKTVGICAKPCDAGTYTLLDEAHRTICYVDGYVPRWLGEDDSGDYIELEIDLETEQVLNWKAPTAKELERWMDENS